MAPVASAVTRVLVTGFGPFGGVPDNPSWGIASRMPSNTILPNNIELIVHPSYVPVAYHPVIDLLPDLISEVQPDIALHMGVAAGRTYFAVEQTSQKDQYSLGPDVDGELFKDAECEAIWSDQPKKLSTDIDLHAVVADWQDRTANISWPPNLDNSLKAASVTPSSTVDILLHENVLDVQADDDDVRWSDAVGNYLCAFIYYADMVEMSRNGPGKRRDVAFMHVPMLDSEEELQVGVNVAMQLVQSLVQTWLAQRDDDAERNGS